MPLKGSLQVDHIGVHKYQLLVVGLPPLTPIKISGIEEEIQSVQLADRTAASGGNSTPITFDVTLAAHHAIEIAAMEAWLIEARDPVLPTYKKAATVTMTSISGNATRSYTLMGVWAMKRGLPDLDMNNAGDLAEITYTLSADTVLPI